MASASAEATGFALRRGSGFDLEVLDHTSGAGLLGPARPDAPVAGLWVDCLKEPHATSRHIALAIGVSRDVATDAARTLAPSAVVARPDWGNDQLLGFQSTLSRWHHRVHAIAADEYFKTVNVDRRPPGVMHQRRSLLALAASRRIALSRAMLATTRLSRAFSCSSSFMRLAWSTLRPPYPRRQR